MTMKIKLLAVLTFAVASLAAGCGSGDDARSPIDVGRLDENNAIEPITGSLALGSEIELVVREPDPKDPSVYAYATVAGYRVEPAENLLVTTNPLSRHLVLTALREGDVTFTVTTEANGDKSFPLHVSRPARFEAELFSAPPPGKVMAPMPDDLRGQKLQLLPDGGIGFALHAFDNAGAPLVGGGFARWIAPPDPLVTIESWGSTQGNRVWIGPQAGATGDVTLRVLSSVVSSSPDAVTPSLEVPLSIVASPPSSFELRTYQSVCVIATCNTQPLPLAGDHASLTVHVGKSTAVGVYAIDADGAVLVTGAEAKPTIAPVGQGIDAFLFLAPNFVWVSASHPGNATVTTTYLGRTFTVDVTAVP